MAAPAPIATTTLACGPDAIARAARLILAGEPVAVAAETTYTRSDSSTGLAADATSDEAVARVYAAKGRPEFNPLIVHVLDAAAAARLARFSAPAQALAAVFWPGPLTMVLPAAPGSPVEPLATAGLGGWVFYNTNVLNAYHSSRDDDRRMAEMEKALGRYIGLPQPKITDMVLNVDLKPNAPSATLWRRSR